MHLAFPALVDDMSNSEGLDVLEDVTLRYLHPLLLFLVQAQKCDFHYGPFLLWDRVGLHMAEGLKMNELIQPQL